MKTETAKKMIDAFRDAKIFLDQMPPLEPGFTPAGIRTIDAIYHLRQKQNTVHPSDISAALKESRPATARTLKQLECAGAIQKKDSFEDGRRMEIRLTDKGERIYQKYVDSYYGYLTDELKDIDENEILTMIHAIEKICERQKKEVIYGNK